MHGELMSVSVTGEIEGQRRERNLSAVNRPCVDPTMRHVVGGTATGPEVFY